MTDFAGALRRTLDALYFAAGALAAVFLMAILALIVAQMVGRWLGFVLPGATDYVGYCMAASSFLAFAHALGRGAHIRVGLILNALGPNGRWLDGFCFATGAVISTYFAWYAIRATRWSFQFGDVSQGLDRTPLWIPQLSMCVGGVLLAVAFWDHLARLVLTGDSGVRRGAEDHG
jgi:TRAP-type C4-dicarboxylate transport system permease small subunit